MPEQMSARPSAPEGAQIVVAGHICLDVIPELPGALDVQPGGLVVIGPSAVSTGGPVGNVGMALHRLGVPVRLIAKVGEDMFGRELLAYMRGYDPALAAGMIVVPGETTSYSIIVNPPGIDRTVLHCAGANDTFGRDDVPLERLEGARILHFGYPPIMRRLYSDGGTELAGFFRTAQARGLVVSLDTCVPDPKSPAGRVDWRAFLARVLSNVDVFTPSVGELRAMLRLPAGNPLDLSGLRALAGHALALGPAVFALKLGDQGLYLRTAAGGPSVDRLCERLSLRASAWRDREVLSPCFRARRVAGTNGSGDSTIAGLLTALLHGEDAVAAATSACAVGACSVEEPDASSGVPKWADVATRRAAGWTRLPIDGALRGAVAWQVNECGTLFDPRQADRS